MKVPPGVSASDFAEAIKQFEEAVGKEWVFTSDEDVAMYRDAYSPFMGSRKSLSPPRRSRRMEWSRCKRSSGSRTATRFRSTRFRPGKISATAAPRPYFPAAWCWT